MKTIVLAANCVGGRAGWTTAGERMEVISRKTTELHMVIRRLSMAPEMNVVL